MTDSFVLNVKLGLIDSSIIYSRFRYSDWRWRILVTSVIYE